MNAGDNNLIAFNREASGLGAWAFLRPDASANTSRLARSPGALADAVAWIILLDAALSILPGHGSIAFIFFHVPGWKPADVSKLDAAAIEAQNSTNHKGQINNVLGVAGYVQRQKRPDVNLDGGVDKDNIYTASGDPNAGSQSATSLDIRKHLSASDTFLIGPVGRKAE